MFLTVCLNPTIQKTLRFPAVISGTVNRTALHRIDVSGKGINVTRVLAQLGKKALHLTQLGGVMKPLFLSLCEKDGLSVEWAESNSEIRFCYTLLTDGAVTELVEESQAVAAGTEDRLLEKYDALLNNLSSNLAPVIPGRASDSLIISGTKAAGYSDAVIPSMAGKAKEKGLRIILDIKGKDLIECLKYEPDIVKPNLYEFAATFAPELIRDNEIALVDNKIKEQIKSIMTGIAEKHKCGIILTNGREKILAAIGNNFLEFEIPNVKTINSTGCGDAFTAGLAAALEDGAQFEAAVTEGIRCGALNAGQEKPGCMAAGTA